MSEKSGAVVFGGETEFEKRPIEAIYKDAQTIDVAAISKEIIDWLLENVENYVDNETKIYKIDLVIDGGEMPETKKLQDLYRAIPDEEVVLGNDGLSSQEKKAELDVFLDSASDCRRELDKITALAYSNISENKKAQDQLFKRLVFFYEKIIHNTENKKRAIDIDAELKSLIEAIDDAPIEGKQKIQEQVVELIKEGETLIKYQEFEGRATITKFEYEAFSVGVRLNMNSSVENMKEYTIPEGFVIWLELTCKTKQRPTAIF